MLENTAENRAAEVAAQAEPAAAVEESTPVMDPPEVGKAAPVTPAKKFPKWAAILVSILLAVLLVEGGAFLGLRWFETQSLSQARIKLQNQDWAGAEVAIDQVLSLESTGLLANPLDLILARAEARYHLKKYDQAGADFNAFQAGRPQAAAPYLFQARIAFEQGNIDQAVKAAGQAHSRDDKLAFPYAVLAYDAYRQNDLAAALTKANEAIQLDPEIPLAYQVRGSVLAWQMDVDPALADLNRSLEQKPDQPDVLAVRAYLHSLRGDRPALTADADAIKKAAPGTPAALWAQALVSMMNYDEDTAIQLLDRAIQLDGSRPEYYLARAESLYKTEQEKQILADYDQALKLNPDFAPAVYGKAMFLYDRYKTVDLDAQAARLLALAPKANLGHLMLVEKYLRTREWEKAMETVEKAIASQPCPEPGILKRGEIFAVRHDLANASADFQKVIQKDASFTVGFINLAKVYIEKAAYEDALKMLDQASKIDPDSLEVHYVRALVYINQEDAAKAKKEIEAAIKRDPGSANMLMMRALVGMLEKNNKSALSDLNRVGEIYPEDPRIMAVRAGILAQNKDTDAALAEIARAEKIDNKLVDLYTTRAQIYLTQGELEKAAENAKKALEMDPQGGSVYLLVGSVDLQQGKLEEAVSNLRKAIDLKPSLRTAHYFLGLAQWNQGEVESAVQSFQKMLAMKGRVDRQAIDDARQTVSFLKTVPELVDGWRTVNDQKLNYSLSYPKHWVPRPPHGSPLSQFILTPGAGAAGALDVQVQDILDESLGDVLTPDLLAEYYSRSLSKEFANFQFIRREAFSAEGTSGVADIADYRVKNEETGKMVTMRMKIYYFVSRLSFATLIYVDAADNFEDSIDAADEIVETFHFLQ